MADNQKYIESRFMEPDDTEPTWFCVVKDRYGNTIKRWVIDPTSIPYWEERGFHEN